MKNGTEMRKNGNMIIKIEDGSFRLWHVKVKQPDGSFLPSKNGPWTYIYNARNDADGTLKMPHK